MLGGVTSHYAQFAVPQQTNP